MAESQSGWSDQLAVQYAPMDATHHEFVELCAALGQADSSNFLERLDAMIAHSVEHFEQENQWMAAFDPSSLLELDYADLCDLLTWDELDDDHSARDIHEALDALDQGEYPRSADVYQGVLTRWAEVRSRELLN